MNIFSRFVFCTVLCGFHSLVQANPPATTPAAPGLSAAVAKLVPNAQLQGSSHLKVWGFNIYKAYLWRESAQVFALDLHYLRKFSGEQLAKRSVEEMQAQGRGSEADHKRWLVELNRVFSDVGPGDHITGVSSKSNSTLIFLNGRLRGEIAEPAFTEAFFAIWLSDKSSQPLMRRQLLGIEK